MDSCFTGAVSVVFHSLYYLTEEARVGCSTYYMFLLSCDCLFSVFLPCHGLVGAL